jgi:hypothetical protein
MSIINLENMKTSEKFIAMEEIWDDLSKNVNADEFTPDWHVDILDEREKKVFSKESSFLSLEEVKNNLQKITK